MTLIKADDGVGLWVEADRDTGKPPLLFSNSLGTSLAMWDDQIDEARRDFRVVRYDSRGHGRSEAPKGAYSMDRLGRDALAVLDAVAIGRTAFCGLSLGGMVGMWLGVHAPQRLTRLALCNTSPKMPVPENFRKRAATVREGGMAAVADMVVGIWFTGPFIAAEPETVAAVREGILATPAEGYAACCEAIAAMDQEETIRSIGVPTLVVVGSADTSTPPERGQLIHERIAGSRLETLNAAHLSNIEQREAFNRSVLGFLK